MHSLVRSLVEGHLESWMLRNEYLDSDGRPVKGPGPYDFLVAYARVAGDTDVLRILGRWVASERVERNASFTLALKHRRAEAFLDYLRRRIKPPKSFVEVPRPIHVRPRPPTAPVAPPLT